MDKKPGRMPGPKELANLRPPFEKGNKPTGHRPKGSRNWKTVVKEFLQTKDPKTGRLWVELLGENTVRRAVMKGGSDLETILDRVDGQGPMDLASNPIVKAFAKHYLKEKD